MMRSAALLSLLFFLFACTTDEKPGPISEPGEKLYTVRGVVMSRNAEQNSLNVDHEDIPGFMSAMRMDYTVRGAEVAALPADKSRIEARLHVTDRSYWITDVKQIP